MTIAILNHLRSLRELQKNKLSQMVGAGLASFSSFYVSLYLAPPPYCENHNLKSSLIRKVGSAHPTLIEKVQDISLSTDKLPPHSQDNGQV